MNPSDIKQSHAQGKKEAIGKRPVYSNTKRKLQFDNQGKENQYPQDLQTAESEGSIKKHRTVNEGGQEKKAFQTSPSENAENSESQERGNVTEALTEKFNAMVTSQPQSPQILLTKQITHSNKDKNYFITPDLHGSWTKLLEEVLKVNAIEETPEIRNEIETLKNLGKDGYDVLKANAYNYTEVMRQKDVKVHGREYEQKIQEVLAKLPEANGSKKIIFIGDLLADREENTLHVLLMFKALAEKGVDFEIIYSNHDDVFIQVYKKIKKDFEAIPAHEKNNFDYVQKHLIDPMFFYVREETYSQGPQFVSCFASLIHFALSMNEGVRELSENSEEDLTQGFSDLIDLVENTYLKHLKLAHYEDLATSEGKRMYVETHAPQAMLDLEDAADIFLDLKKAIKNTNDPNAKVKLCNLVDMYIARDSIYNDEFNALKSSLNDHQSKDKLLWMAEEVLLMPRWMDDPEKFLYQIYKHFYNGNFIEFSNENLKIQFRNDSTVHYLNYFEHLYKGRLLWEEGSQASGDQLETISKNLAQWCKLDPNSSFQDVVQATEVRLLQRLEFIEKNWIKINRHHTTSIFNLGLQIWQEKLNIINGKLSQQTQPTEELQKLRDQAELCVKNIEKYQGYRKVLIKSIQVAIGQGAVNKQQPEYIETMKAIVDDINRVLSEDALDLLTDPNIKESIYKFIWNRYETKGSDPYAICYVYGHTGNAQLNDSYVSGSQVAIDNVESKEGFPGPAFRGRLEGKVGAKELPYEVYECIKTHSIFRTPGPKSHMPRALTAATLPGISSSSC